MCTYLFYVNLFLLTVQVSQIPFSMSVSETGPLRSLEDLAVCFCGDRQIVWGLVLAVGGGEHSSFSPSQSLYLNMCQLT